MQSKQLLLGMICSSLIFPMYAKEESASDFLSEEEEECSEQLPSSFRISAVHREGKGIGYNKGYSSIDGFFTFSNAGNWHPFFDARAHMFNDGKLAANAGFGVRYQPQSVKAVFGVNGFFDYRHTYHSTFEQLGFGFEALGTKWEGRVNSYFPIICRNNLYGTSFTGFSNHNALFSVKRELAFKGFDLSLGRTLLQKQYYSLGATLGGYMFFADYNYSAKGGLFKLKTSISPYLSLEGQASYDNLFKGIVQGQVSLNIPFGKRVKTRTKEISCPNRFALASRITEAVDRFEIIVVDKYKTSTIGKNPRTHEDLYIVFVDNTASAGGNGTAEFPYNTLLAGQNNSSSDNMIYVYAGTGSPAGMNAGISMQERQWLQGSGIPFLAFTDYGLTEVPAQTINWPTISSSSGSTITLNNGNIVSGFNIFSKGTGISGTNVNNIQCTDNRLSGTTGFDITLSNVSGSITLIGNESRSQNGLSLSTSNDVLAKISENLFANSGSQNINLLFSNNSNSRANLELNEFSRSQDGSIIAVRDNAKLTATFEGNNIEGIRSSANYAIRFSAANNSILTAVVNGNLCETPTTTCYDFLTTHSATSLLYVVNNTGTYTGSSTGTPFNFVVNTTANSTLALQNNVANSNGYFLSNSATSIFNVASSSLSISDVESSNTGTITTGGTGIITYVSPPSSVPDSD